MHIIATLGPGSKNRIEEIMEAGATAFRINCSHSTLEEISFWLVELERAYRKATAALPVWLDLQGAKMRIGKLRKPEVIRKNDVITFTNSFGQVDDEIPVPHPAVFGRVKTDDEIFLNDGKIILKIIETQDDMFRAKALTNGELSSFKGFKKDGLEAEMREPFQRDLAFIEHTNGVDYVGYAVSFVQSAAEINLIRRYTADRPVAAKIERSKAFDNLIDIADVSDSMWLCRGDLGVEANVYNLFHFEKKFIQVLELVNKPLIIAGQVLENMVSHPYPSRSEISHLGYLMENGYTGLVLSDETAVGKYPVEAVEFCSDYFEYVTR